MKEDEIWKIEQKWQKEREKRVNRINRQKENELWRRYSLFLLFSSFSATFFVSIVDFSIIYILFLSIFRLLFFCFSFSQVVLNIHCWKFVVKWKGRSKLSLVRLHRLTYQQKDVENKKEKEKENEKKGKNEKEGQGKWERKRKTYIVGNL